MQIKTDQLSHSIKFAEYPIVLGYLSFYDGSFMDKIYGGSSDSDGRKKPEKLISDDLLKALEEQTLESDYNQLILLYNAIETQSLHGASPTQLQGLLTEFRVRLNAAKKAYDQHKKAIDTNVNNKSLSAIAMTPQGTVFVQDDDGNLINVTVEDYIDQYGDRPMFTNEDLLVLRDKHGQFAFNDTPITIASHGISESTIKEKIKNYVKDLKTGEATIEGYHLGEGKLPGSEELVQVITKTSDNFSEEGRNRVLAATWEMLTDLEKNYLKALAAQLGLSGTGVLSLFDNFVVTSVQSHAFHKENKSFIKSGGSGSSSYGAKAPAGTNEAWHNEAFNIGNARKGESSTFTYALPIGVSNGKDRQSELNNDKYVNLQLSAQTIHNLLQKDELPMIPGYRSVNSFTANALGASAFVTNSVTVGGYTTLELLLDNNAVLIDPSQMQSVNMYSLNKNGVITPNRQIYIDLQREIVNPLGKELLKLSADEPGDNLVEKFNSLMSKLTDGRGNLTAYGQKFLMEIHNGEYKFIDAFTKVHTDHGYNVHNNGASFIQYALLYLAGIRLDANGEFSLSAQYNGDAQIGYRDFTNQFAVFKAVVRVPAEADKVDKQLKLNDADFKYMPNKPKFVYTKNDSVESEAIAKGYKKHYETTAFIALTNTAPSVYHTDKYKETFKSSPSVQMNNYNEFANIALGFLFNPNDNF